MVTLNNSESCDVLIIGSGIAGLSCAYELAKENLNVIIVTKKNKAETNTNYAQGGIAAVLDSSDSFDTHISDTLIAGDGLCDKKVVEFVVRRAPERIQKLIDIGVNFTKNPLTSEYELGKEGAHSKRRILHSKDSTGKEIERALLNHCENYENIVVHENYFAIDLIKAKEGKILGVHIFNQENQKIIQILAKKTILATGGIGKVYLVTSNPDIATGDGIAMAYRAGAEIANMEFTQFHPTCLFNPKARSSTFLLSEALRGEGAKLINSKGVRFMNDYDSRCELAPRDVVARAIDNEMKQTGDECVYLDITFKDENYLKERFPGIYQKLLSFGYNLAKDKIPIVPAAHYICGGVLTDLSGKTNLENLYCIGESASTGLHGANRLASNSLLEAIVFAYETYKEIVNNFNGEEEIDMESNVDDLIWRKTSYKEKYSDQDDRVLISHNWNELRLTMWNYVGIVRSKQRLDRALKRINNIKEEVIDYLTNHYLSTDLVELWNLIVVSETIIKFALKRKESRGIHYRIDYPNKSTNLVDLILRNDIFREKHVITK
ncbi:MAG: L-aspartate oxidase [Candidatus Heimdallarchaeota archaeon LC_3]|nr:MAG: L-aspartate oxidase [Candidatus Heimdallarchaeota archaeon LC_3]